MKELEDTLKQLLHDATHHDGTFGGTLVWVLLVGPRAIAIGVLLLLYIPLSVLKALLSVLK